MKVEKRYAVQVCDATMLNQGTKTCTKIFNTQFSIINAEIHLRFYLRIFLLSGEVRRGGYTALISATKSCSTFLASPNNMLVLG